MYGWYSVAMGRNEGEPLSRTKEEIIVNYIMILKAVGKDD